MSWNVSSTISSKGFETQPPQPWWYVTSHVRWNFTWMFSAVSVDMIVLAICSNETVFDGNRHKKHSFISIPSDPHKGGQLWIFGHHLLLILETTTAYH